METRTIIASAASIAPREIRNSESPNGREKLPLFLGYAGSDGGSYENKTGVTGRNVPGEELFLTALRSFSRLVFNNFHAFGIFIRWEGKFRIV